MFTLLPGSGHVRHANCHLQEHPYIHSVDSYLDLVEYVNDNDDANAPCKIDLVNFETQSLCI